MSHSSNQTVAIFFLFFLYNITFPSNLKAQKENHIFPWNAELPLGAAVPTADLAETVDMGANIGARFGYSLRERLMIRGDVGAEFYQAELYSDNRQLWNYSAGVEYLFTDKGGTEWRLAGFAGMGASTLTGEDSPELPETYFSLNYGVKFGRGITDNFDWFINVLGRTVFANPNDNTSTGIFTTLPISVGINHRFNQSDKSIKDKVEQPPN
ncbi:hypothetical protein [Marivirga sp.]|uniref:hypothetical protein n=1 Tax=Marivirga sp. TaxID=2018662 RepID=UPI003DA770DC